ncbi:MULTISPECIES: hypothetical protein [Streptomyces]|uniref:Uncharacterized protein n=2 Tax=Streptomyces TaxID=1883 RepID=A0A646KHA0_STRJU|nr:MULTISPECIES: hypothetical protein [Streptomyces]MQS40072.1 hypothetical protein [Streptomyces katsurahamanus]MQT01625.1 hypothetical protein [Streptomyces jumonjinensis]
MSAHTPISSRARDGAGVRLPWWALALPVLAFVLLLVLIADPAQAQTAGGGQPGLRVVLEYLQHLLTG